jgi:hypothetical protein
MLNNSQSYKIKKEQSPNEQYKKNDYKSPRLRESD